MKRYVIFGTATVLIMWLASPFIAKTIYPTLADRGLFGDSYGAINSLFSGLAFIGVLITLNFQIAESRAQSFENKFFQLVSLHHTLTNGIQHYSEKKLYTGKEVFIKMYDIYRHIYPTVRRHKESDLEQELFDHSVGKLYEVFREQFTSYFVNLYNILSFIDQSHVKNKKFYANILRAQLSPQELLILYYNCVSCYGNERFKPLLEKYAFFNNLLQRLLIKKVHTNLYDPKAFG